MLTFGGDVDTLSDVVTGRVESLFGETFYSLGDLLSRRYSRSRVLVTGGAGFIATQTIRQILPFAPAKIVVADVAENSLTELVRDLRASGVIPRETVLEPRLVDVTGPMIDRLVANEGPFDIVLAFAAAKHVRSERDPISVLQMLNVNINGTLRTVRTVLGAKPDAGVFIVSTDKAADPGSIMGASKRVMELAVLGTVPQATATRFANVAFSSGSLLESWLIRLSRGQVLPVPADTRRFFVSPRESGQLCAIASVAPPGSIVVPRPGDVGSIDLHTGLKRVLDHLGLTATTFDVASYEEALRLGEVSASPGRGAWPVLLTERNTAGEKGAEIFVGAHEVAKPWLDHVELVGSPMGSAAALGVAEWIAAQFADEGRCPSLDQVLERLRTAIPNLSHIPGSERLDDRV